jgi:acyl-CoA hydrolase
MSEFTDEQLQERARHLEAAANEVATKLAGTIGDIVHSEAIRTWPNVLPLAYGVGATFVMVCRDVGADPHEILAELAEVKVTR